EDPAGEEDSDEKEEEAGEKDPAGEEDSDEKEDNAGEDEDNKEDHLDEKDDDVGEEGTGEEENPDENAGEDETDGEDSIDEKEDSDGEDETDEEDSDEKGDSKDGEESEEEDGSDQELDEDRAYHYDNGTIAVDVILEEESTVPEDAELVVKPITEEQEEYANLREKAENTVLGEEPVIDVEEEQEEPTEQTEDEDLALESVIDAEEGYEEQNELEEDVRSEDTAKMAFYDISFYTSEGDYCPVTDTATVTMNLSEADYWKDADEIAVLHYPEDGDPTRLELVQKEEDSSGLTLTFQTEGFSVFGIVALTEEEPVTDVVDAVEEGTFVLTYTKGGQEGKITFLMVDSDGNRIPGDYTRSNIIAEDAKRYVFGEKDASTETTDSVEDRIVPEVEGYTYVKAVNPGGIKFQKGNVTWTGTLYSVATEGYSGAYGPDFKGLRFYTSEPVSDKQYLSWGYGEYTVTLVYKENTEFNDKTFAIVNQVNGKNYALTASKATVNTVSGLASQSVVMTQEGSSYQVLGEVTQWTFHRQDDGTYTVSTIIIGEDGEEHKKYLFFCESPYNNENDGRGSLTLTDVENASSIIVTETEDGRVTMVSGQSCINMDMSGEAHSFWCFNDTSKESSKHYLCKIAEAQDYSGDWAIVNVGGQNAANVAMQTTSINTDKDSNRAGRQVQVKGLTDDDNIKQVLGHDATIWHFEKQQDGTYYISTSEIPSNNVVEYLNIGAASGSSVTLKDTPQPITITPGSGEYAGMVRLTNSSGMAVNLFDSTAEKGFGSLNDSRKNEWQTLCMQSYDVVTTTANHPSSVINLFDYWLIEKEEPDDREQDEGIKEEGINSDHTLKFSYHGGKGGYNGWTGSKNVYPDIVKNTLQNGYPVLKIEDGESLDYLFDPTVLNTYKESHRNVSGLLQVDSQGYSYYNSAENFAEYHQDTNSFTLYDTWGVNPGGGSPKGQFFPFNSMDDVVNVKSIDPQINHYLGLTLTTRFVQQYGGHTTSARTTDTVFNFAGDDDVWIFIDDVLVADLGGIHDRASVSINFDTGDVTINDENAKKLKTLFEDAGQDVSGDEWNGETFADNTYHTLKFFYLERGNTDSNLYLQYNLTEIPLTAIYKVNQYGEHVADAEFAVYKADENYTITDPEPAYVGVTDDKGEMVFADPEGMPYSLSEIKNLFGEHFVLKETQPPPNYSLVSDEIHLYISNGLLLCDNTYDSGVWSSTTLQVAASNTLQIANNGGIINYYDLNEHTGSKGTLFAVVLKYAGKGEAGLMTESNWNPVYGNDENGYTIVNDGGDFISQAIYAAQQATRYGNVCFSLSASGAMQLEMTNLPGNISNYYYMLKDGNKGNTQYTVAYYWTSGSLADATSSNTYRIDAENNTHTFDRAFGAIIEVPNLINRLFAQKLNEEGELVNGATFALYQVEEEDSTIYYIAEGGTQIELTPDADRDNCGIAKVKDQEAGYTYQVNAETGVITVESVDGDETPKVSYRISPYKVAETLAELSKSDDNPSGENGTATFSGIENGKYYLREVAVPTGYQLNPTEVMVLVADNAVYANAGTEDDGVTVARGPGYLVATLSKFASEGDIDNTLSWLYEQMRISGASNTFSAYENEAWENWGYLKENNSGIIAEKGEDPLSIYLEYAPENSNSLFNYTVNRGRDEDGIADSIRRRLYTTVGWSYYELYQDVEYGETHCGNANYTKITNADGTPQEIANLFSRSTYIQVMDQKVDGELEIRKIVKNAPQNDSTEYTFTVLLKDAKDAPLEGSYTYWIYNLVTTTEEVNGENVTKTSREPAKDASGNEITGSIQSGGTITLTDSQVAVIEKLPAGTRYTVEEVVSDTADYIISAVRDEGKAQVGSNTGTGEKSFDNEVTGTLYWSVTTDENKEEIIDNTSTNVI
ncbi:MAG: SpaA isopeptide-forming pilin-related protein, partial [Eubacteriales bacterium]|nr:SpaA isopeptide-forming pilin-related protein [Eubacteriales bacterium]